MRCRKCTAPYNTISDPSGLSHSVMLTSQRPKVCLADAPIMGALLGNLSPNKVRHAVLKQQREAKAKRTG